MTWKTLGESLEAALASALNTGDGDAEAFPVSPKRTGTEAPASWEEVVRTGSARGTQPGTKPASLGNAKRGCTRVNEQAPLGVHPRLTLFVIEGGRPAGGGSDSRAAHARLRGERRSNLKLVAG